ncbi:uncharacterized protein BO97DRAFT_312807, partial [Aspergillus homomorphus CBS 101889]
KTHGLILFLTFSISIPLATFLIRRRFKKAFVIHWGLQLGNTIASASAIMIMLVSSWASIKVTAGPHQYLGFMIFILLFVQLALCYLHHLIYKKRQRPTLVTLLHITLGWLIM